MSAVKRVLVIGGGIAGMCCAIELRKRGIDVDLVEIRPRWQVYGAGITLNNAGLRAFKVIGVLPQLLKKGAASDGCDICTPNGRVVATLPTPRIAGPEVPGGGGILRPVLAHILSQATRASGTQVRLGVTFARIEVLASSVRVAFTDGSTDSYDLLVGADGLFSKVRGAVFADAPSPKYTGQGIWRATVPLQTEIRCVCLFMGRTVKAGLNPVSKTEMYLFVTEERPINTHIPETQWPALLKSLLAEFSGPIGVARDSLSARTGIVYRPLEAILMPRPWHRGRVVLVGDAAHATTPHLASGAAIGVEDAIVLAQALEQASGVDAALDTYGARRFERCRMVVENSLRLGQIKSTGGSKDEHARIMRDSMTALAGPIP